VDTLGPREIPNQDTIPEWCPLPDHQEVAEVVPDIQEATTIVLAGNGHEYNIYKRGLRRNGCSTNHLVHVRNIGDLYSLRDASLVLVGRWILMDGLDKEFMNAIRDHLCKDGYEMFCEKLGIGNED
jgi:hypothetical protein